MINHTQLRELVIQPALNGLGLYSKEAEEMLISICAQETQDGFYLKQTVGGKDAALGIFQMQPETHESLWENILSTNKDLKVKLMQLTGYLIRPKPDVMIYNLLYAAAMARIFWVRIEAPMPSVDDIEGRWNLYKKYWNTPKGKATYEEFVANYNRYVKGA